MHGEIANTNLKRGNGLTRAHPFTAFAFLATMAVWLVVAGVLRLSAPVAAKGLHVVYGIQFVWSASIRRGRRKSDKSSSLFVRLVEKSPVRSVG
jgi:hypothetical protein